MSDQITPQLREKVLGQLRQLTASRNIAKTAEEIENVFMEKSRGDKKTYLNYLSKVINSAGAGNSGGSHMVPVVSTADHMANPTQGGTDHMLPSPRSGMVLQPHQVSQSGQLVHVLPASTTAGGGGGGGGAEMQPNTMGTNRGPRFYTITPQANPPPHLPSAVYQQQPPQQRPDVASGVQPMQPNQPGAISTTPNRAVPATMGMSLQAQQQQQQQAGVQGHHAPLLLYPQGNQQQQQQQQSVLSMDQSQLQQQQQQSTGRPIQIHSQATGQQITYHGENYSGGPGSNAVVIRAGPIGTNPTPLAVTSADGSGNIPMTLDGSSAGAPRPLITVVPGNTTTQGQPKVIRGSLAANSKIVGQGTKGPGLLTTAGAPLQQQPVQPNVIVGQPRATTGPTNAGRAGVPQPQQPQRLAESVSSRPSTAGGPPAAPSASSSSSGTKAPQPPYSPEVQAKIVSGLTKLASRFLPAVRHAIQVVSEQPESALAVRKYVKLKDILEHPEANLNVIRLTQLTLIEQLLNEIARNPLHLVQQQQQQQQQSQSSSQANQQHRANQAPNQARAAAAAAAVAAAAAKTMTAGSMNDAQRMSAQVVGAPVSGSTSDQAARQRASSSAQRAVQQQGGRFRDSSTSGVIVSGTTTVSDTHGGASAGQMVPRGAAPARSTVHGSGTDFAVMGTLSQPLGVSTMELGGPNMGAATGSGSLGGLVRHSGPESRLGLPPGSSSMALSVGSTASMRTSIVTGFSAFVQPLISDLQKMVDRALHDPIFARRACRAINEISLETKTFRETMGLLLPQDLHLCMGNNNSLGGINGNLSSGSTAIPNHTNSQDVTDNLDTGSSGCLKSMKRLRSDSGVNQHSFGVTDLDSAGDVDMEGDHTPVDREPSGKKRRVDVDVELVDVNAEDKSIDSALSRPNATSDASVVTFGKKSTNEMNYLFTTNSVPNDAEADPLDSFAEDQLERLNPRIRREIRQLLAINLCVKANAHPPPIEEMETYATCLDAGEWNSSCHLKVIPQDELISHLPCAPPVLFVRLAPDYLEAGQMNWYYEPRSKHRLTDPVSGAVCYSAKEQAHFLDLCYSELDRKLQQHLRRATHYRLSLFVLGKHWLDSVCSAMARFVKIDQNIPLLAK